MDMLFQPNIKKLNDMMIDLLENTADIVTIFKDYLEYMSHYFVVNDYDSWCKGALKNLNKYSTDPDRYIYIVRESESIIGFAFVCKHLRFNLDGFAIADFFIQKAHMRKKTGSRLAEYVFKQFPGNWEVAVTSNNHIAKIFWIQVVSSYTHNNYSEKVINTFDGSGFLFNNSTGSSVISPWD